MIIAIDFDGTIVEHEYPAIGRERPFATATIRRLKADGHIIILWTYREGDTLREAVEWCRERGVEFDAVNTDDPLSDGATGPRKINADVYIDDRNVGGLPDWGAIYEMITNRWSYRRYISETHRAAAEPRRRPSLWRRLFGKS